LDATHLPLSGIKVLEFCHTIMGPTCGLVLADLGADVIKIEPTDGDRTRRLAGFAAGFFAGFNRNKRSLAIDMKTDEGRRLIYKLVATADVAVENFAVGTMEKLGCGYEDLKPLNSRLIYCALKGFLSGPYEHRPALDEVVQFMAGLAYMTGPPGRPLRAGASIVDILGGTFGVIGILAAIEERHRTGEGKLVKSALFESTAFLVSQHMAAEVAAGEPVPPMPARRSAWMIYETFPTADEHMLFVGITSNNHWQRFCEAFDLNELLADPALQTNEQRVEARLKLVPIVANVIRSKSIAEMMRQLEQLKIPYAPVARPGDLFDDPHLNHAGRMHRTYISEGRYANLPGIPVEIGGQHMALRMQPPAAGEHSAEILREIGITDPEIARLEKQGVVRTKPEA
jgi:crotonobetainyl-CoA:carnitine CoA-transferase CaiB-like acyl-CoA transferase